MRDREIIERQYVRGNEAQSRYLEAEVLTADPVKLVSLLFRGANEAVAAARRHLRNGQILERSARIVQAHEIVQALSRSLDHDAGGEVSHNLAALYAYIQMRLLEANTSQTDSPLSEAENLLALLAEAWKAGPAVLVNAVPTLSDYKPLSCVY